MTAKIHYTKNGDSHETTMELPDSVPHAEAWEQVREAMRSLGIPKSRYRVTGILTDKQRSVLAFLEKHHRCTLTHVAHHLGCEHPATSAKGYAPLMATLKKLKLVRETEYLGHRTYILFHPKPRFPRGEKLIER